MQDFTMSLKQLVDDELIDREVAMEVAPNREALKMALKGIEVKDPGLSDAATTANLSPGIVSLRWPGPRCRSPAQDNPFDEPAAAGR